MAENDSKNTLEAIKIVQGIITRMANNSFVLKGWTVTAVVVALLISGNVVTNIDRRVAFIPILAFWLLDSYYLHLERLFRKKYRWIVNNPLSSFSEAFDLDMRRFRKWHDYICAVFSITEIGFYLSVALMAVVMICQ